MSNLITDWQAFCEGRKAFDKSHFYTLFMDNLSDNDLDIIFSYLPNTAGLISRLKNALDKKRYIKLNLENRKKRLIELVYLDLQQKKTLLQEAGQDEIVSIIENAKYHFIENTDSALEYKINNDIHFELFDTVAFDISQNRISNEDKIYAIFEAFYGLVEMYEVVWYLGAPLVNTSINFDYYFELWAMGGDYALTKEGVIVTGLN